MREALLSGVSVANFSPDKPFFSLTTQAHGTGSKVIDGLKSGIQTVILNGVYSEWTLANNKNNELCNVVSGNNVKTIHRAGRRYYRNNEMPAMLSKYVK